MKTLILTLIILIFSLSGIAQEIKFNDPYTAALTQFCNPVAFADTKNNLISEGFSLDKNGKLFIDTILVQKENYLPDVLPERIKQHVILCLSKEEINNFKGRHVSLMTMSPMRKYGPVYYMRMTNYLWKRNGAWTHLGYHEFKFTYDAKTKKYNLDPAIITFCNSL